MLAESCPGQSNEAHTTWDAEEAVTHAQRGDAGAFECLYRAHSKHVYGVCLRMLKNTAEAEDLTQQVFLRVFRKIGTFRGESGFSTWLHKVTVNAVLMHLRRKLPVEVVIDCESGPASKLGRFDNSAQGLIDRVNLRRAIHTLPPSYKRLFLLYEVIGYDHAEIAGLLKCSTGCSKSRLHKARKWLRRALQGEVAGKLDGHQRLEKTAERRKGAATLARPLFDGKSRFQVTS